jgi:hypothetical protein
MLRTGQSPSSSHSIPASFASGRERSVQRLKRMTIQGGNPSCKKPANNKKEIYTPISVIYGELQDLFMEVFRNVGLFIQVSVGFVVRTNVRKTPGTQWIPGQLQDGVTQTRRRVDHTKKGSRFSGSPLVGIDLS